MIVRCAPAESALQGSLFWARAGAAQNHIAQPSTSSAQPRRKSLRAAHSLPGRTVTGGPLDPSSAAASNRGAAASSLGRFQDAFARIIKQRAPQQPASSTQPCILSATNPDKKTPPWCMISSFRIARQAACSLGNLSCPLHRGPFLQLQLKPQQQLSRPFRRRKFHDRGRPARKLSR